MNYLIDTDALIEHQRANGSAAVKAWLQSISPLSRWLCPITYAECLVGTRHLRDSRLRQREMRAMRSALTWRWADIDVGTAEAWAQLAAVRPELARRATNDSWIAAVAMRRGFIIATGNTRDFAALGLQTVNPFLA